MNVICAKTAGFCFGVSRAIDAVHEQIERSPLPVYTYGPIIHNSTVVKELSDKGVAVVNSRSELDALKSGTVIIRSHGVPKEVSESLDREGIIRIDATCPFVAKIHDIVRNDSKAGSVIVIAGDAGHPEVVGIMGQAVGECYVVDSEGDIDRLVIDKSKKVTFVAQTTYNYEKFKYLVEKIKKMGYHVRICETVCGATAERQKEAGEIAEKVDAMIVIGDRHSSNSRKLYEICKRKCKRTYFIETKADLEPEDFQSINDVGITAGASTPKNLIEEVQNYVRRKF